MKELLIRILDFFGLACWLEIKTESPRCTYYFGPFLTRKDAIISQDGYIEDLLEESAKSITVAVKRLKPKDLTIFDEVTDSKNYQPFLKISTQIS